jgi:Flp pilus assembly CpaF family ATPase
LSSVRDQSEIAGGGSLPEPRPLDRIVTFENEDPRFPRMQETWSAFAGEMGGQVLSTIDNGRSPAEIAYGIGIILHNYFRSRGIPLTTYELRALANEFVDLPKPDLSEPSFEAPVAELPVAEVLVAEVPVAEAPLVEEPVASPSVEPQQEKTTELVSFDADHASAAAWAGEDTAPSAPILTDAPSVTPPSPLVNVVARDAASFDKRLLDVVELAGARLGVTPQARIDRNRAREEIDRAIEEVAGSQTGAASAELHGRLAAYALTEICGLGLIDRLWADRSIRAIFVDGPHAVHVARDGGRRPSTETFRDANHLRDLALRLARPRSSGVVEFSLRDGGNGVVIFPPAATEGPVLMVRRGEPGNATFDRLIASDMLDGRIAALLRVATRARLSILVVGPEGSGKTALLAAMARDLGQARLVTLARHREFRWASPHKVELVAQPTVAYTDLMLAGLRLQPDLLVLDSIDRPEAAVLVDRLMRGAQGLIAALRVEGLAGLAAYPADLIVRLGSSGDSRFRVQSVEDRAGVRLFVHEGARWCPLGDAPVFAQKVRSAGYGEALSSIFR